MPKIILKQGFKPRVCKPIVTVGPPPPGIPMVKSMTNKEIEELSNTNCWFNFPEFYQQIAQRLDINTIVEVGVWKGHSISYLAGLLRNRPGIKIYAVDLFEKARWLKYQREVDVLSLLYNYNLNKTQTRHLITDIIDYSDKAALKFEDASIDFVFLDADHEYESVKKDINAWYPKVRSGGIIAGHDRHFPGVKKAVQEFFTSFEIFNPGNRKHSAVWYFNKSNVM